jgi:hypothetical protein
MAMAFLQIWALGQGAPARARSRRGERIGGEKVFDRVELPDALGRPGRAFVADLILVRVASLGVFLGLFAFESLKMGAKRDGNDFFRSRRGGAMRGTRPRPLFLRKIASAKPRAEGQAATFTIDQSLGTMSSFAAAPTADRWLMDRAGIGFARCFESFG